MSDEQGSTERTRTITWADPAPIAEAGRTMSGLEFLRAMADGSLPFAPIGSLMNIRPVEVEQGRVVFVATPQEYHYNPIGVAHGGLAATLLDSAMGCSVHSALPAGVGYTTIEIKVNYVRALTTAVGEVRAEGKVIHVGGRLASAEGRIVDAEGRLYAHGSTTCMIFR